MDCLGALIKCSIHFYTVFTQRFWLLHTGKEMYMFALLNKDLKFKATLPTSRSALFYTNLQGYHSGKAERGRTF
jgi:hypothetical protein